MSQSYSVLSDPDQRRSYDLTRTGSSVGQHRRRPHHPGYTSASGGQGYAAGSGSADGAWTDNDERRTRANYAWQHPSRSGQKSAGEAAAGQAQARADPFASRRARATHGATDHFATYAERARTRSEQASAGAGAGAAAMGYGAAGSHYRAGTSVFGAAKAEEESRLINDSSTLRSGQVRRLRRFVVVQAADALSGLLQVVFVFLVVFALAYGFSGGKERHENKSRR